MGEIYTASERISTAATLLGDPDGERWSQSFLLAALNDGQRDIVGLRPDAMTDSTVVQLAGGVVQSLPAGAPILIGITRNMGVDGQTPGQIITLGDLARFERANPLWMTDDPEPEVRIWFYDKKRPRQFLVYPPQPATGQGYVELVHPVMPADIAADDFLTIPDSFAEALLFFVMSRALMVEGEKTFNGQKAADYRRAYVSMLSAGDAAETATEPEPAT